MKIIAVTGYRGYTDGSFVHRILGELWNQYEIPLHIRVGDAWGADLFVRQWCERNQVSYHMFRAHWVETRKKAGPERNERMLLGEGDPTTGPTELLVGFPRTDGVGITVPGSGTWGCLIRASQLGIAVEIPPYIRSGY